LQERIKAEFELSEEYATKVKHEEILKVYREAKAAFAQKYGCQPDEYDYVYNVHGKMMNHDYYLKIFQEHNKKRSYRKSERGNYGGGGFDWSKSSAGSDYDFSKLFASKSDNYTAEETAMLKNFYKVLSKNFHPDITKGDGKEMQFLNKLKMSWGI